MSDRALHGVWVAMPTPWTEAGTVDEGIVTELVARYADAGLHGTYTTGTDGELHVMEFDELDQLVRAFSRAAEANAIPVQVGCGWLHTPGVIERGRLAQEYGINRIQITLPSWIPLNDDELLRFYGAIQEALPTAEFIHYNIMRSGRMLTGTDYQRILEVAPNLAGSKHTGGDIAALSEIIQATPNLAHFVVDNQIVAGALFGSPGFFSFIANLSPAFALKLWGLCEGGQWEEAARLAVVCQQFFRIWLAGCKEINSSSALGKIATRAGVHPRMPLGIKEPYTSGTQEHVDALRALVKKDFPEIELPE